MELSFNKNHVHGVDEDKVNGGLLVGRPKYIVVVASNNIRASSPTEETCDGVTYIKQHRMFRDGVVRVTALAKRISGVVAGNLRFRVDGVDAVEYTTFSTSEYYTKTYDIAVTHGCYFDIRAYNLYVKDLTISFDRQIYG